MFVLNCNMEFVVFQMQYASEVTYNYIMIVLLPCEFNIAYFPIKAQSAYLTENITNTYNNIFYCQIIAFCNFMEYSFL